MDSGRIIDNAIGAGVYSAPDAARLLQVPPNRLRRWIAGYHFGTGKGRSWSRPLFQTQFEGIDGKHGLSFRDLMELRFVAAFQAAGLSLGFIRIALDRAADTINDDHPFSTARFQSDGETIFLELSKSDDVDDESKVKLLDLKRNQYGIRKVIEPSFRDLDIEHEVVAKWWPMGRRLRVLIDPKRRFGAPIASESGVPVETLVAAVHAEGSIEAAYGASTAEVRDALAFQREFNA